MSNRAGSRRGRLWGVWLACSTVAVVVAVGLLVFGGVALDHTTGHFGRISVPGESYGLPDPGTYLISDGNYAASMHQMPDFVVTGPEGEPVPVETVPSHRYGHEDNALALFHVPRAGSYRLEVMVDGKDLESLPSTVTVDRSWDGTGDPLNGAWASLAVGGFLLLLAFGFGIAFVVSLVRRFSTGDGSTVAPSGHPARTREPHGPRSTDETRR